MSNMSDCHYYQYAFAGPDCRVEEIGAGVDARFRVELIATGRSPPWPAASAWTSSTRKGCKAGRPKRSAGWARSRPGTTQIICQAAGSSPVLPLRLGTVFRSRDSLQATLAAAERPWPSFCNNSAIGRSGA